jgi:hypothetical protein
MAQRAPRRCVPQNPPLGRSLLAFVGWVRPELEEPVRSAMLPNPFCPLRGAAVLSLKATVLLLLTLLIKARIQIRFFSALGVLLLLLQTLAFLVAGGVLSVAGVGVMATSQRR